MVYVLLNAKTGTTAVLGFNNTYKMGRSKSNDISLNDWSCSKLHAEIQINDECAYITDLGSKRGTLLNGQKVSEAKRLRSGDIIIFGKYDCKYRFFEKQFVTVADGTLAETKKTTFQETLAVLNAELSNIFTNDCTHYTTEYVSMDTLKYGRALDALIYERPLVTVQFWIDFIENMKHALEIPNTYKYMPEIREELKEKGVEIIWHKRMKRKVLFKDTLFIFSNDHLKNLMWNLISKCGGDTVVLESQANFSVKLVESKTFSQAVVVREPCELEIDQPLTVSYLVDKLRQYDKPVYEMTDEDIYIAILKGVWQSKDTSSEKNVENKEPLKGNDKQKGKKGKVKKIDQPVAKELPIIIEESDKEPEAGPSNGRRKKVYSKTRKLRTLEKWITPRKKKKNDVNEEQIDQTASKNDDFDRSLSMSSDSDSANGRNVVVEPVDQNKHGNSVSIGTCNILESPGIQRKTKSKRRVEITISSDESDGEDDINRNRTEENNIQTTNVRVEENCHQLKTDNNNGRSGDISGFKETSGSHTKKSDPSTKSPKSKSLKINPFSKAKKNGSIYKAEKDVNSPVDIRRLNKIFKDVQFLPA